MFQNDQTPFTKALLSLYYNTNANTFEGLSSAPRVITHEPLTSEHFLEVDLFPAGQVNRPHLISFPDSRFSPGYFSPRLEHSDQIVKHTFTQECEISLPHNGNPCADGFIVAMKNISRKSCDTLNLGMRTADCLTWVSVYEDSQSTVVSFAHLGWRSFAMGLHFKIIEELNEVVDLKVWGTVARHYLAPSIFGRTYPCGASDVGQEFENLQSVRLKWQASLSEFVNSSETWLQTAARLSPSQPEQSQERAGAPSGNTLNEGKCYPDLQLLCLLDLVAVGVSAENILLHRVNTAASKVYPSYRHGLTKDGDNTRRLVTSISWKPPAERNRCTTPSL